MSFITIITKDVSSMIDSHGILVFNLLLAISVVTAIVSFSFLYRCCCWQNRTPPKRRDSNHKPDGTSHVSRATPPPQPPLPPTSPPEREQGVPTPSNEPTTTTKPLPKVPTLLKLTRGLARGMEHSNEQIVSPLRKVVQSIEARLHYRFVTNSSFVGGGLESLFVPPRGDGVMMTPSETPGRESYQSLASIVSTVESTESMDDLPITEEMRSLMGALGDVDLFQWLPDRILRSIAASATFVEMKPDEVLYSAAEDTQPLHNEVTSCYIVVHGEMSLLLGSRVFTSTKNITDHNHLQGEIPTLDERTGFLGRGRMLGGVTDFIRCVTAVPCENIATATCTCEGTVIASITKANLDAVFEANYGLKEELLTRALVLFQRVTFASVYRLTGRYAITAPDATALPSPLAHNDDHDVLTVVAHEFGIPLYDLEQYVTNRGGIDAVFPIHEMTAINEVFVSDEPTILIVTRGAMQIKSHPIYGNTNNNRGDGGPMTLQLVAKRGQSIGTLSVLTHTWSSWYNANQKNVIAAAEANTRFVRLRDRIYFDMIETFPEMIENKARALGVGLTDVIRLVDHLTTFMQANPGDVIEREGEECEGLKVVLHGFLRATRGTSTRSGSGPVSTLMGTGGGTIVAEYSRGDVIGELSYLTMQPNVTTIRAVRHSSLALLPRALLQALTNRFPSALNHMARIVSNQFGNLVKRDFRGVSTKRTVVLIPVSPNVNLDSFSMTLKRSLEHAGTTVAILTSSFLAVHTVGHQHVIQSPRAHPHHQHTRNSVSNPQRKSRVSPAGSGDENAQQPTFASRPVYDEEILLMSRLNDIDDANDMVFYICDSWLSEDGSPSKWSKIAVSQADVVLLVANTRDTPGISQLDASLRDFNPNAHRELALLHIVDSTTPPPEPTSTRDWIECIGAVAMHIHVRVHPYNQERDVSHFKSDFARLGRWLTGRAVGLVLGGGGARGAAHVATLKVLEEAEIPIDFVGGTSIGAFIGGLYSLHGASTQDMKPALERLVRESGSLWLKIKDFTLPVVSYMRGSQLNKTVIATFGEASIEDLWLNFFCCTTDLTDSRSLVHRNGFLWKYVRASMSLAGFLPPVCDVVEKAAGSKVHYLVDGGYSNNLPVDVMRSLVGSHGVVISVDVQSDWTLMAEDFGHDLNGWWLFWRWVVSPIIPAPRIPAWSEIQSRLAYVACVQQEINAKDQVRLDLALKPVIGPCGTLEFSRWHDVERLAYQSVKDALQKAGGKSGLLGGGGGGSDVGRVTSSGVLN